MASRLRIVACLLAGALLPIASGADSVLLKNGQSFEGVEAVVADDYVRIELAIGSMRLPMSQVASIEEVDSTLGEYRARESRLGRDTGDAEGWLALAQWARANDFKQGIAKAALTAARLDPQLAALDPVMTSLDYLYDEKSREWVPYDDAMRRQGLVEDRDTWVTPEEKRDRSRARVEAIPDQPRSRADDHLDKALDILAEAVKKPDAPSSTTVIVQQQPATVGFGAGFGLFPGFVTNPFPPHDGGIGSPSIPHGTHGDVRAAGGAIWDPMTIRQPGSFIPLRHFR